jgi:hypothetical protein
MVAVDAHVHLHDIANVSAALTSAACNFSAAMSERTGLRDDPDWAGVLLLTEARRERVFDRLAATAAAGAWQVRAMPEPESLTAEHDHLRLLIVSGRQVRARDGLEVLALGSAAEFKDGMPFEETLAAVTASGALAVVPWGFGKWLGQRGRRVRRMIERSDPRAVWLGDNGGRLSLLPQPALLRAGMQHGFRVLPGTDPFPFGRDYGRIGCFGFHADVVLDPAAPWQSLRNWLDTCEKSPPTYGRPMDPVRFALNQLRMQFHNRRRDVGLREAA